MTTATASGKLFIAGEYAVVEPGEPAVLVAVDRFVTVQATPAADIGTIASDHFGDQPVVWTRDGGTSIAADGAPLDYVRSAVDSVHRYARSHGREPAAFDFRVVSDLDDRDGRKYGLGSSAAVTVALVRAAADAFGLDLRPIDLFKLSLLATIRVSPASSGGDIAASVFGGWVEYRSPDRRWLAEQMEQHGVASVSASDWPGLDIRELPGPRALDLVVGWTGQPASTDRLVASRRSGGTGSDAEHRAFLERSAAAVAQLSRGLEHGDDADVLQAIRAARRALEQHARQTGIEIETPALRSLSDAADRIGAAGKSSGAGGGDCGVALVPDSADLRPMLAEWDRNRIRRLDLRVAAAAGRSS